jgi:hypothetical protein
MNEHPLQTLQTFRPTKEYDVECGGLPPLENARTEMSIEAKRRQACAVQSEGKPSHSTSETFA